MAALKVGSGSSVLLDTDGEPRESQHDPLLYSTVNAEDVRIDGTLRSDPLSLGQFGWRSLVIEAGGKLYMRSVVQETFAIPLDSLQMRGKNAVLAPSTFYLYFVYNNLNQCAHLFLDAGSRFEVFNPGRFRGASNPRVTLLSLESNALLLLDSDDLSGTPTWPINANETEEMICFRQCSTPSILEIFDMLCSASLRAPSIKIDTTKMSVTSVGTIDVSYGGYLSNCGPGKYFYFQIHR